VLFPGFTRVLWSTPGLPGLLADSIRSVKDYGSFQWLVSTFAGIDLPTLDYPDIHSDLPGIWLGLGLVGIGFTG